MDFFRQRNNTKKEIKVITVNEKTSKLKEKFYKSLFQPNFEDMPGSKISKD